MSFAWRSILVVSIALVGCKSSSDADPECIALCERTPTASATQAGCVSDFIEGRGYDTDHPRCVELASAFVAGNATAAMCEACYRAIDVTGDDCAAAESACFGVPPDSGPGDSGTDVGLDAGEEDAGMDAGDDAGMDAGADGGMDAGMDAGPPDVVNDCDDLCRLAGSTSTDEGACTADAADSLGYDLDTPECNALAVAFFSGTANRAQCNQCYESIAASDADCRSVYLACY